jgi:hypothetical protein
VGEEILSWYQRFDGAPTSLVMSSCILSICVSILASLQFMQLHPSSKSWVSIFFGMLQLSVLPLLPSHRRAAVDSPVERLVPAADYVIDEGDSVVNVNSAVESSSLKKDCRQIYTSYLFSSILRAWTRQALNSSQCSGFSVLA